jgi:hypothetical protein
LLVGLGLVDIHVCVRVSYMYIIAFSSIPT